VAPHSGITVWLIQFNTFPEQRRSQINIGRKTYVLLPIWKYNIFLSDPIQDISQEINKITQHIPSLVTQEQNEVFLRPIKTEEVDQVMKEMPVEKAPRPDSFMTDFFYHYWPMVRDEVWKLV